MPNLIVMLEDRLLQIGCNVKEADVRWLVGEIEAAGYRIAGPEPTEEMIAAGQKPQPIPGREMDHQDTYLTASSLIARYKAMHGRMRLYGSE